MCFNQKIFVVTVNWFISTYSTIFVIFFKLIVRQNGMSCYSVSEKIWLRKGFIKRLFSLIMLITTELQSRFFPIVLQHSVV